MISLFGRLYDQPKQRCWVHSTQPISQGAYQIATFITFYEPPGSGESIRKPLSQAKYQIATFGRLLRPGRAAVGVFVNPSHRVIFPFFLAWSPLTTRQGGGESLRFTSPTG